jgi:hypothetical protein
MLGIVSLARTKVPPRQRGAGFAKAAIILSALSLVPTVVILIIAMLSD